MADPIPVKINPAKGLIDITCTGCGRLTQLPTSKYIYSLADDPLTKGKLLTLETKDAEGKSTNIINLVKEPGHTANCDFYLVNAPATVEIVKEESEKKAEPAKTDKQPPTE